MTTVYNLKDIASPMNPISSTASISFSLKGKKANSFSLPPFLFYAFKAKRLARLGIRDESKFNKSRRLEINKAIYDDIREIAKSVHRDALEKNIDMANYISASIQGRILFQILGETEENFEALNREAAVPINASNSKKNVTIPDFLFKRVEDLFCGEKPAKLQVHSIVADIKKVMTEQGGIDKNGKLVGDAANSSWSRKLHNKLFYELIEMSNINEIHSSPSIFEVKMERESRIETRVRNGKISTSS